MPSYDATHFDPPAPIAQVILRDPHSGAAVSDVPLLMDTGDIGPHFPAACLPRPISVDPGSYVSTDQINAVT